MAMKSSLELMLDRIQQLEDQPKDEPPALPVRPISKARRPSARRPWPISCSYENGILRRKSSTATEALVESFRRQDAMPRNGGVFGVEQLQLDHFGKGVDELLDNSDETLDKGILIIQRSYRAHKVQFQYKEFRKGVIALQSFVRGENARKDYNRRSRRHNHVDIKDHIQVPHSVIVDLQKEILRTEAKAREKKEENFALKKRLQEMEKKWKCHEERMKSFEKTWQDQLLSIQKCLAASKRDPAFDIQIRKRYDSNKQNADNNNTLITGIPNGRLDRMDEEYHEESDSVEVGNNDPFSSKMHSYKELEKLKLRFKVWKKEYKNKLKEAQSTFKRLSHSQTEKSQKKWWGRFSQ